MINETASISILGCAFTMTADTLNKQVFSHLIHTSLKFSIGLLFIVLNPHTESCSLIITLFEENGAGASHTEISLEQDI